MLRKDIHNSDQELVTCSILLDLYKSFDTVDHQKLLEKLEKQYGIRGLPWKLHENYLANRTRFENTEGIQS